MAMIAFKCPEHIVTVVDINQKRIDEWNSDNLPVFEPGLARIVQECRGKNLFFSKEIESAIEASEMIFVSVNTPTKAFGIGRGKAADLRYVEACARTIADAAKSDKIVVEKSTLPVRTAESLKMILESNTRGLRFEILSNPEFLAEGTAIRDLEAPDRVLIGGNQTEAGREAIAKLSSIYERWVQKDRILTTNLWSSELSKLVANAFLAQRISSINSISALCEETGADVEEVARSIGMDSRIGSKFLNASVGFGGSCFQKDILNLVYICEHFGLQQVANYWSEVVNINNWQKNRFVKEIHRGLFGTVAGKKIAIFGFAFKKDTNDARESPAIEVCRSLIEERANVVICDPKVESETIYQELGKASGQDNSELYSLISISKNPYEACNGCHAVAIITDWDVFRSLDYKCVYEKMLKPAFLFDGRNLVDKNEMVKIGFEYYSIGKPRNRLLF